MIGINRHRTVAGRLLALFAAAVLILGVASCGAGNPESSKSGNQSSSASAEVNRISEVSPPEAIQKLRQALKIYQPQISILFPLPDEVLQDINVSVQFQVKDFPIFQEANLGLGPHLQVLLDNQPYATVYDVNQPLTLSDLEAGTHTLQMFATSPWEESFKNEGALAQTTFHVFTKTQDNNPDRTLPLLTYNSPQGSYGAEPILLDFYLTNAPLHHIAQENSQDEILDWKIRATVNGESFAIDQWQPIYLKGFKPGKNWIQLQFIDERGNIVKNVFNNTVRLINYEPQGQDTISKLVRGELTVADTRGIVDRTYEAPKPTPTPTPEPTPEPEPTPALEKTPVTEPTSDTIVAPEVAPVQAIEPQPTATPQLETPKVVERVKVIEPQPIATPQLETPKIVEQVKVIEPQPIATPQIETPKIVEQVKVIEPQPIATPQIETPKIVEQVKVIEPQPIATPQIETPKIVEQVKQIEPQPIATPQLEIPKIVEPVQKIEPQPTETSQQPQQKIGDIINHFRNLFNQITEPKTPSDSPPQTQS